MVFMKIAAPVLLGGLSLLMAGCAVLGPNGPRAGQSEAEVVAAMGRPTAVHPLADGRRLEYATGPYGRTTWMVDVDASGRVVQAAQVLTEANLSAFQARAPGMGREDLLRTLGRPGERRGVGWQGGETWSWRYVTNDCLWFQVSVDRAGVVQSAGFAIDPACDAPNDRD